MFKSILGYIKGEPEFPYNKEKEHYAELGIWKLYKAKCPTRTILGTVTIFEYDSPLKNNLDEDTAYALAKSSSAQLKSLKHPHIMKYIDGYEYNGVIRIVTEYVTPLKNTLKKLLVSIGADLAISWGSFCIIKALEFLHAKKTYHHHLCLDSIFVVKSGDWKLGELGFSVGNKRRTKQDGSSEVYTDFTQPFSKYTHDITRAPEVSGGESDVVQRYPAAADIYGLGLLLFQVFSQGEYHQRSDLKHVRSLPATLQKPFKFLVSDKPKQRPPLSKILALPYFKNEMISTQLFLEQIQVQELTDIPPFMAKLSKNLESYPRKCIKYRILPALVSTMKYAVDATEVIGCLFAVGELLNEEEVKNLFLPAIVELYKLDMPNTKLNLLRNIHCIELMDPSIIQSQIFPSIVRWLSDKHPRIREMSVKALVTIVPKLTPETITSKVTKIFWTMLQDKEASIRTNTLIAIGKLCPDMPKEARDKLLLPAFNRGLKDPFVFARMNALRALIATREYYTWQDVSTKIVPMISPAISENELQISELALSCLDCFLATLKEKVVEHHEDLKKKAAEPDGDEDKLAQEQESSSWGSSWGGAFTKLAARVTKSNTVKEVTPIKAAPIQTLKPVTVPKETAVVSVEPEQTINDDIDYNYKPVSPEMFGMNNTKKVKSTPLTKNQSSIFSDDDDDEDNDHDFFADMKPTSLSKKKKSKRGSTKKLKKSNISSPVWDSLDIASDHDNEDDFFGNKKSKKSSTNSSQMLDPFGDDDNNAAWDTMEVMKPSKPTTTKKKKTKKIKNSLNVDWGDDW